MSPFIKANRNVLSNLTEFYVTFPYLDEPLLRSFQHLKNIKVCEIRLITRQMSHARREHNDISQMTVTLPSVESLCLDFRGVEFPSGIPVFCGPLVKSLIIAGNDIRFHRLRIDWKQLVQFSIYSNNIKWLINPITVQMKKLQRPTIDSSSATDDIFPFDLSSGIFPSLKNVHFLMGDNELHCL